MALEEHYDEIARCNRCGFCQAACPVFRATGHEGGVARGRIALLRAVIEGRIEWDKELEEPLFACLLCGACTANCFPAVATADLILDARSEYLERVGRKPLHRLLFQHLLPYPKRLRLAARAAAVGKKTGLSKVARALGLLRIFGRDFPRAEGIIQRIPPRAFREEFERHVFEGQGEGRIGYFVGCGSDIMCPEAARASLGVLRRLGRSVEVLQNGCCGLPPLTYGDRPAARELAGRNLELLGAGKFDLVVTDCSSCAAFLKKYPTLFDQGDPRREVAAALAASVRDLAELIAPAANAPPPARQGKLVATYHDPCHAARGQGIAAQPREVLRGIPGIEYRELPEADWCCGGAGSYALAHYDLSRKVLDRKIDNVEKTGADLLVTSCPACIIHLSYGIRQRGLPVRVCHISELLAADSLV
jgi:glycolate oxidase iron-sulfur subunit